MQDWKWGLGILTLAALAFGQACDRLGKLNNKESSQSTSACATPSGQSGNPQTIEEAIALINALPKPVSVSCFLESLKRPLGVTMTSSSVSAQPAFSLRSPRIFILTGGLVISVVPEGNGSRVVEFSQVDAQMMSVKGEVAFPVTDSLSPSAAYDRILFSGGTACRFCHGGETRAMDITSGEAYRSQALRPLDQTLIDVNYIRQEWLKCDSNTEPDRCAILRGLFGTGEVRAQGFPANMPTL